WPSNAELYPGLLDPPRSDPLGSGPGLPGLLDRQPYVRLFVEDPFAPVGGHRQVKGPSGISIPQQTRRRVVSRTKDPSPGRGQRNEAEPFQNRATGFAGVHGKEPVSPTTGELGPGRHQGTVDPAVAVLRRCPPAPQSRERTARGEFDPARRHGDPVHVRHEQTEGRIGETILHPARELPSLRPESSIAGGDRIREMCAVGHLPDLDSRRNRPPASILPEIQY